MDVKVQGIQPGATDQWRKPDFDWPEAQGVAPVPRIEGTQAPAISTDMQEPSNSESQSDQNGRGGIKDLVSQVQSYLDDLDFNLNFKVDDDTKDLIVQVVRSDTGELIRQIPPEELRNLRQKLEELRGVLFDGKV